MFPEAPSSERITVADTLAGAVISAIREVAAMFSVWKKLALSAFGNDIFEPLLLTTGVVLSSCTWWVSLLVHAVIKPAIRQLYRIRFFMLLGELSDQT